MFKEGSSSRISSQNVSKNSQSETNENEFENLESLIHLPLSRTPLNSIPDPSQCQKDLMEWSFEGKERLESIRVGREKKVEGLDRTPRVSLGRSGKVEANSVHSTLMRSGSRFSLGGGIGCCTGSRSSLHGVVKGASYSKVCGGVSIANSELATEIPHFELAEDPSFWTDHNVQVLIRIRPLSTVERASQGYGRCLRQESGQTLLWLGHPETRFTFDHIAGQTISQEKLFRVAGLPMVENCMSGYNSCMFAYGQTGSGKTYTMMGEIYETEGKVNEDCGITPRIFEYLFTRIRAEEESRRDEKLQYSCKCSFLEIYNEQITDLLEPSSTNLQLREDLQKGVYVENLTECSVRTVNDVLKLLIQGAANRKIAATHMNSESSRSHSVFTCIIEGHWEKDSMTHIRFARLNLVDLAGSERQKSSGAEGDRLKEAANINKSLSTLGLVIMSLVDLAHGKHRHVPYRDSRLTFLLQDSLGGNSKTTIIANVSPSMCSANETLSTLKFAQRAKLIQNNAKVNEDASGDITALQRQVQQLKGQLSFLMKNHNLSKSLSTSVPSLEEYGLGDFSMEYNSLRESAETDSHKIKSVRNKEIKFMEATLAGTLRREKTAVTKIQKLEAEIENMNRLACQREEDAQHGKLILKFREEKIKRLELLVDGSLATDKYLMEENSALLKEIQVLQAKIDRNPEMTRCALDNLRLFEQLQIFQNFYEQGERDTLLTEISGLRDQLLELLEGQLKFTSQNEQEESIITELEHCRNMNSKLLREMKELQTELSKCMKCSEAAADTVTGSFSKDPEEFKETHSSETVSVRSDFGDEITSYTLADDEDQQYKIDQEMGDAPSNNENELMDARVLIEVMESEQVHLIKELQLLREENCRYVEILSNKDKVEKHSLLKLGSVCLVSDGLEKRNANFEMECSEETYRKALQAKLDNLATDLEEAKLINGQYEKEQTLQLSHQHQVELVREQVEMEATRTILHLQEELSALQSELHVKLCCMTEENIQLRNTIMEKEEYIRVEQGEWEKATLELTSFLVDGSRYLQDASSQIERIACSFPQVNVLISENVEKAARVCVEKEETVQLLQKSLEDAQKMVLEMELKLASLKGATMALTEFQQMENGESTEEAIKMSMLFNEKINMINVLENKLKYKEAQIYKAEKCANAAFVVVKWLSDCHMVASRNDSKTNIPISELSICNKMNKVSGDNASMPDDIKAQLEFTQLQVLESERILNALYADTEMHVAALQIDICQGYSAHGELVQNLVKEIHEMRKKFAEIKEFPESFGFYTVESSEAHTYCGPENQYYMLHQILNKLSETNDRLDVIRACISPQVNVCCCLTMDEDSAEGNGQSLNFSTSCSYSSPESVDSRNISFGSSYACCSRSPSNTTDQILAPKFEGDASTSSDDQESGKLKLFSDPVHGEATGFCLRKELEITFNAVSKLYFQLSRLLHGKDIREYFYADRRKGELPSFKLSTEEAEGGCRNRIELLSEATFNHTAKFLTKFEEAHTTIKEADFMLNALLEANENAKQLTGIWKQAGEELMVERASLIEEIKHLKSTISLNEVENEILQEQIRYNLVEMANSISAFEESFAQMQKDVEEMFKVIYSDVFAMGQDMMSNICNSRSSVEDICSKIMEKGFALVVLLQCHVGKIINKMPSVEPGFHQHREQACHSVTNDSQNIYLTGQDEIMVARNNCAEEISQSAGVTVMENGELGLTSEYLIYEKLALKKELERKDVLLQGLLFDLSLLQESASSKKDIKDECEKLVLALIHTQDDLAIKTSQLDEMLVQHKKLEDHLADTENALCISNSELERANETLDSLSDQNSELRVLIKDLYLKKSEAEEQLEEQKEMIKGLETEILHMNSSEERKLMASVDEIEDNLKRVTSERDKLHVEICSLNEKLEMACALADENEAIAVEARQESEASKIYAEQKEEEVKILEHSVDELECTINVMEKKVNEMNEEVEKRKLIKDSLELELQSLRHRLMTVENFGEHRDSEHTDVEQIEDQISRQLHKRSLELHEASKHIRLLEKERSEHEKEIKQCKEYITELVLHSEAQASQYQQKYKTLEAMICEVKTNLSNSTSSAPTFDKTDKNSVRTRGSSSPFRCISNLVQQMNSENDQELSLARIRIEELEALVASEQKEVCMLNTRLAAAESMTHDVIRDLLGVKLDMINYANLIDQLEFQKLVEEAQQQREEFLAKEQEIIDLRKHINDLIEERESSSLEINRRKEDILSAQMTVEQLQERDQLLTAQNEMLKMDKMNLKRRVAEMDEMVKTLLGTESTQLQNQQTLKLKENRLLQQGDTDFNKRVAHSGKILSQVNDELAQYRISSGSRVMDNNYGHSSKTKYRKIRTEALQ